MPATLTEWGRFSVILGIPPAGGCGTAFLAETEAAEQTAKVDQVLVTNEAGTPQLAMQDHLTADRRVVRWSRRYWPMAYR